MVFESKLKKSKEEKKLIYLEKETTEEDFTRLALKILRMYDEDFNLTIKEISSILQCNRKWVERYVKDEVKHIFLNNRIRNILLEKNREYSVTYIEENLKDYYYFSREDFYNWLKNNTTATKQTQLIDINIYSNNILDFKKAAKEYYDNMKGAGNSLSIGMSKIEYEENISRTLNHEGKEIFSKRLKKTHRGRVDSVRLKNFEIPEKLVSIKDLKEKYKTKNDETIYRELFNNGAIKYTIAGSLVRYDKEFWEKGHNYEASENPYIIVIPYKYYLKNIK
ncbi:hypothetical protein [Clostridium sp.]|jgi:hypothetical protein|uniref:hypothetical protein n=1 Tax=Clostridium sp. TaxID=1506 RepID=UPI0025C1FB89|nr:hypothetical protein [Clostridium sp.]MCI9069959.1 hypothetical protein [Clostridium sp.]